MPHLTAEWESEKSAHPECQKERRLGYGCGQQCHAVHQPEEKLRASSSVLQISLTGFQNKLDRGGEGIGGAQVEI